jgi:serine/threonine protein kinase
MAPKLSDEEYAQKVDVYSFALILYEIMTGCRGFSPDSPPMHILNRISNERYRPTIPDSVLPWVRKLFQKCWDFDPDKRPAFSVIEAKMRSYGFQLFQYVDRDFLIRHFEDLCSKIKAQLQSS